MSETVSLVPPTILEQGAFAGYKEQILDRVRVSAHGIAVMDACKRWGLVHTVELMQHHSSFSRHGSIVLGIRPDHEEGHSARLFAPEQFSYLDEHAYAYLHESWHRLFPIVRARVRDVQRWYTTSLSAREVSHDGLTILGSSESYTRDPAPVRAEEDMVELFAMASFDPDYLRRFLNVLSDTSAAGREYRFAHRLLFLSKKRTDGLVYALQKGIESITMYPKLSPVDEEAYRADQFITRVLYP